MGVEVELTYDMGKSLGSPRLAIEAASVADVVDAVRARFDDPAEFELLTARTAIAINGVLARYRDRLRTPLSDGDRVSFVKAAAGG